MFDPDNIGRTIVNILSNTAMSEATALASIVVSIVLSKRPETRHLAQKNASTLFKKSLLTK